MVVECQRGHGAPLRGAPVHGGTPPADCSNQIYPDRLPRPGTPPKTSACGEESRVLVMSTSCRLILLHSAPKGPPAQAQHEPIIRNVMRSAGDGTGASRHEENT
uniref:Uncharacterized protein n=1 Tax=Knipowitschia caucasica TaxID=637954 RepID=A0AAV2LEL2_KNICA